MDRGPLDLHAACEFFLLFEGLPEGMRKPYRG